MVNTYEFHAAHEKLISVPQWLYYFTDEQFVLPRPAGSQLINLDSKPSAAVLREDTSKKPQ